MFKINILYFLHAFVKKLFLDSNIGIEIFHCDNENLLFC